MEKNSSFEENLKDLEELVRKLDNDDLTLDESIKMFESGMELSKKCSKKLEEAEKKINILVESSNGDLKEEKFKIEK